jgi:hypothetical protein
MAGLAMDLVQVFRALRDLHFEFLRLRTDLKSPLLWLKSKSKCFMHRFYEVNSN